MLKLLAFLTLSCPLWGAWTLVNDNIVTAAACATSAGSSTNNTIASTTAGNELIVSPVISSSSATITWASTELNASTAAFTLATSSTFSCTACSGGGSIGYRENIAGGLTSIIFVCSATISMSAHVYEVSGLPTSSSLDIANAASNQTACTSCPSASVSTTATGDFVIAVMVPANNITGVGSGYTEDGSAAADGNNGFAHVTSTSLGTGSTSATFTQDVSGATGSAIAAFKISGGAASKVCTVSLLGAGPC